MSRLLRYGFIELKTHAKLSLVVRREAGELCDLRFTSAPATIIRSRPAFTPTSHFYCRQGDRTRCGLAYSITYRVCRAGRTRCAWRFHQSICASEFSTIFSQETAHAKAGRPASIWMKIPNSLVDPGIIDTLYGCFCRRRCYRFGHYAGICCLRPGVPGLSENIRVDLSLAASSNTAVIYCFGAGHALPHPKAAVYFFSRHDAAKSRRGELRSCALMLGPTVHEQIARQNYGREFQR